MCHSFELFLCVFAGEDEVEAPRVREVQRGEIVVRVLHDPRAGFERRGENRFDKRVGIHEQSRADGKRLWFGLVEFVEEVHGSVRRLAPCVVERLSQKYYGATNKIPADERSGFALLRSSVRGVIRRGPSCDSYLYIWTG